MAKLSRDLSTGTLHPRENIVGSGALGALNAEIVINADGASTVSLDLRGTFSLTVEVAGSVDGVNWTLLPVRPGVGGSYAAAIAGTAAGAWVATCAGFAKVRARAQPPILSVLRRLYCWPQPPFWTTAFWGKSHPRPSPILACRARP